MVFDTNVLVYAARDDMDFHDACRRRIAAAANMPASGLLTWNVCNEFFRVVTHLRVSSQPWSVDETRRYIAGLLSGLGFHLLLPTTEHMSMLTQTISELPEIRGNVVHDMHTAVLMREHGINQICTMDSDFQRFPFVEVVDPRQ